MAHKNSTNSTLETGIERVAPVVKPKTQSKSARAAGKPQKKSFWLWRFFKLLWRPVPFLAYWGVVLGLWGTIAVIGIFVYYGSQLPSAQSWAVPERPPNLRIVAADGSLIDNRGLTGGKALRLEDMSPYIPQAVIAIEDRRFHAHFGFDPIGFARAMSRNILKGRLREGGSTLTQQLAKNLFLKPERTFGRKVQELILSFWLETKHSKADILELYLNRVYFGSGATGVDAASRRYFGKSAKYVTVSEAALLAGLLKAPSKYTPVKNPKLAQWRAKIVLRAMQREGYIKPGNLDVENTEPAKHTRFFRSGPEHFVADYVAKQAHKLLDEVRSDVIVETTIDPFLMTAGHSILATALDKNEKKRRVSQAALLSLAPDGAIRCMIGGRNYGSSQFNRAIEAKRQPGSAFKTFVWLNALERGHSPHSIFQDEPVQYGRWKPENYDKKFRGPVTLSQAFTKSLNTIAAQLTMEAGAKNIAHTATRMGISSKLNANASLALGTSEVSLSEITSAYTPFANGGTFVRPYIIKRITNNNGDVLYERNADVPVQVVEGREISMMNAMLKNVVDEGTGKKAKLKDHPAGGKTGTSQNSRDALFVGYTAHLVTGIWFGNDDNSPTKKVTGGSLPAKAWQEFMTTAHMDLAVKPLPGEPYFIALLPTDIPYPTFRPDVSLEATAGADDVQQTGTVPDNKASVDKASAKRSILDILLGD